MSQTCWELTIGFYGKHLISNLLINTRKLFVDLLKNLIDMLIKYLYLNHVEKMRGTQGVKDGPRFAPEAWLGS